MKRNKCKLFSAIVTASMFFSLAFSTTSSISATGANSTGNKVINKYDESDIYYKYSQYGTNAYKGQNTENFCIDYVRLYQNKDTDSFYN